MNHGTIEPLNEKSQIAQEYGLLLADVRQQRGIVLELSISNFSEMSNKLIDAMQKLRDIVTKSKNYVCWRIKSVQLFFNVLHQLWICVCSFSLMLSRTLDLAQENPSSEGREFSSNSSSALNEHRLSHPRCISSLPFLARL